MNEQIILQVPTQALRRLLADDVEVYAKLNAFACEKIAQEITEKAKKIDMDVAKKVLRDVLQACADDLKSQYRFPSEARTFVKEAVFNHYKDVMSFEMGNVKQELREFVAYEIARQNKFSSDKVNEMLNEAFARMTSMIKAMARAEFLSVLTEVQKGIGK